MVILIVDDQVRLAAALEMLFNSAGFHAVVFTSGSAALEALDALAPKLILLDLHMPTPDGVAVLRAIRQDKTLNDTPVLIHTSDFAATTKQWAAAAGAQGLIVKGTVGCDELLAQVREVLGKGTCYH
jgi:DNA-binding response OmpR family regulator